MTAEKSNEVLDLSLFFSLHGQFGRWEGDDPYVSEGAGKWYFRNPNKSAFLSRFPSFPLSPNHRFTETSRGFSDELLASLCSKCYFIDCVVHMGTLTWKQCSGTGVQESFGVLYTESKF